MRAKGLGEGLGLDTGFDQGFVADSMLRVGFKSVRSRTLTTPWGPFRESKKGEEE